MEQCPQISEVKTETQESESPPGILQAKDNSLAVTSMQDFKEYRIQVPLKNLLETLDDIIYPAD